MKKCHALLLFLAFLNAPVFAASPQAIPYPESNDRIEIPLDSPVHFSGIRTKDGDSVASFSGRFLLTGTYYYGDNAFNDSGDEKPSEYRFDPSAYIIPDADVDVRLPRFAIRNGQHTIFITNPTAFAKSAVSKEMQRRVRCRTCEVATGHVAIWVDGFSAGIECDSPAYEVRFLSVYKPASAAMIVRPNEAC